MHQFSITQYGYISSEIETAVHLYQALHQQPHISYIVAAEMAETSALQPHTIQPCHHLTAS